VAGVQPALRPSRAIDGFTLEKIDKSLWHRMTPH
jgi:hypothetical protein